MKLKRAKLPLCIFVAVACAAVAMWLVVDDFHTSATPNLPFGLFVTAAVAILLAADPLLKVCRGKTPASSTLAPNEAWHAQSGSELCSRYCIAGAASVFGLSPAIRADYAAANGRNVMPPLPQPSALAVFAKEAHEPQQLLLLVVGCLYALVGELVEAALALGIILLVMLAEMLTETRAKRAVRELGSTVPRQVRVLVRSALQAEASTSHQASSSVIDVDAADLVPGDVIMLRAGDEVPADARLLSASLQLLVDESKLTGESVPIEKRAVAEDTPASASVAASAASPSDAAFDVRSLLVLPAATPLAERVNVLHAGTVLRRGACRALVVAIGPSTELGRTLAAVRSAGKAQKQKKTPLQGLLKRVATVATVAALLGSLVGGLLGFVRHMAWQDIVLAALSLAFATIPEELPILVAATLAVGAQSLSGVGIYVKRLRASEALASVDFVLTDKTGTLTEGRLRLKQMLLPLPAAEPHPGERRAIAFMHSVDAAAIVATRASPAEAKASLQLLSAWRMLQETDDVLVAHTAAPTIAPSTSAATVSIGTATAPYAALDPFDAAISASVPVDSIAAAACLAVSVVVEPHTLHDATANGTAALLADVPFDPHSKLSLRVFAVLQSEAVTSATLGPSLPIDSSQLAVLVKGAPEAVIALCRAGPGSTAADADAAIARCAAQGRRMLAFARAIVEVPRTQLPALRAAAVSASMQSAQDALQWLVRLRAGLSAAAAPQTATAVPAVPAVPAVLAVPAVPGFDTLPLSFLGALTFEDPLQPGVVQAVSECASADISLAVITGDHPLAAAEIARQAGILASKDGPRGSFHHVNDVEAGEAVQLCQASASSSFGVDNGDAAMKAWAETAASLALGSSHRNLDSAPAAAVDSMFALDTTHEPPKARVFARAAPAHKLALVRALQATGRVVAVTGDGLNDGPALAAADVGFAVPGATGVAKEAASIVVVQGGFPSLLTAVKEGRRLRANLEAALAFYLGAKAGLVILFIVGTLWKGFPLAPVQIILLELLMDLGASTSFVTEPAEAGIMRQPPRPAAAASFFDRIMIVRIISCAISLAAMVLAGFAVGLSNPAFLADMSGGGSNSGAPPPESDDESMQLKRAQTAAFYCWLIGHVLLAVHQRTATEPLLLSKLCLRNPLFWAWLAAAGLIAVLAGTIPRVQQGLGLVAIPPRMWAVVLGICVVGTSWIEVAKLLVWCSVPTCCHHRRSGPKSYRGAAAMQQPSSGATPSPATSSALRDSAVSSDIRKPLLPLSESS